MIVFFRGRSRGRGGGRNCGESAPVFDIGCMVKCTVIYPVGGAEDPPFDQSRPEI